MKNIDQMLAAAERVLHDVNHNVRIEDSIALATFVRTLLAPSNLKRRYTITEAGRGPRGAVLEVTDFNGAFTMLPVSEVRLFAADLLRACAEVEAGKESP